MIRYCQARATRQGFPLRRMEKHVLPTIGQVPLKELRIMHVRSLFQKLKDENPPGEPDSLAPKTIHHIKGALHKAMADAVLDVLIPRTR
jgi:hypothetical protein